MSERKRLVADAVVEGRVVAARRRLVADAVGLVRHLQSARPCQVYTML